MQSVQPEDFGQLLKQFRYIARRQLAHQKPQAYLGDHVQQPADVVARSAQLLAL